jgi:hypothetical protein
MSLKTEDLSINIHRIAGTPILGQYIENRLMSGAYREESRMQIVVRRILQAGGLAAVAVGRIGVIMICMDGAASLLERDVNDPASLGLGISSGIGNIVVFGILSVYGTLNLIKELTRRQTPEEGVLNTEKVPACTKRGISAASLGIGLLAQVPMAYAAYASSFYAPTLNYLGQQLDFGRASFSTFKALMGIAELQKVDRAKVLQADLMRSRDKLIEELNIRRNSLSSDTEERNAFLQKIEDLSRPAPMPSTKDEHKTPLIMESGDICENSYKDYISAVLEFSPPPTQQAAPLSLSGVRVLKVCTFLMTTAVLAELFELTREGAKNVSDSEAFGYAIATLSALANIHIWLSLIQKSTLFTIDFFRKASIPPVTCELMPRTYAAFTNVGTACSLLTFVPEMFFAKLYFPKWAAYAVGGLASLGTIFGGIGAVHAVRDLVIRSLTERRGKSILLTADRQLEKLIAVLSTISLEQYGLFLSSLPKDLQSQLLCPEEKSLSAYLEEREDG